MRIKALKSIKPVFFSSLDVASALKISEASARLTCHRYVKKGYLIRPKRDLYLLEENWASLGNPGQYALANRLQVPSYLLVYSSQPLKKPVRSTGLSSNPGSPVLFSGKTLGAKTMASVLETVSEDDSIKGVLVRIDSPGGDAFASDEIWRRMVLLRKKKPIVISMSDTAASGGYYIAMTGDPIVAEATTMTGSIGIIYGKLNLKSLYEKLGIHKEILSRGKFSRMDSDYSSYTEEERERVRALMNDFYRKFLAKVGEARKMSPEEVDRVAQGRVWTGEQALRNRLIDELGGISRALEILKHKAGIAPQARVELVEYPRRKSLWELLLSRAQGEGRNSPGGLSRWLSEWERIASVWQSPWMARMPFAVDFR